MIQKDKHVVKFVNSKNNILDSLGSQIVSYYNKWKSGIRWLLGIEATLFQQFVNDRWITHASLHIVHTDYFIFLCFMLTEILE